MFGTRGQGGGSCMAPHPLRGWAMAGRALLARARSSVSCELWSTRNGAGGDVQSSFRVYSTGGWRGQQGALLLCIPPPLFAPSFQCPCNARRGAEGEHWGQQEHWG